jgi:hypothetical protein
LHIISLFFPYFGFNVFVFRKVYCFIPLADQQIRLNWYLYNFFKFLHSYVVVKWGECERRLQVSPRRFTHRSGIQKLFRWKSEKSHNRQHREWFQMYFPLSDIYDGFLVSGDLSFQFFGSFTNKRLTKIVNYIREWNHRWGWWM